MLRDGVKSRLCSPEGMPKPERQPKDRRRPTEEEEKRLRALSPTVGNYLDFVLPSRSGIERHHFLRELFVWAERLTPAQILSVVDRALRYGITTERNSAGGRRSAQKIGRAHV